MTHPECSLDAFREIQFTVTKNSNYFYILFPSQCFKFPYHIRLYRENIFEHICIQFWRYHISLFRSLMLLGVVSHLGLDFDDQRHLNISI